VQHRVDVEGALRLVKDRAGTARPFTPRFVALAAAAVVIMVAGAIVATRTSAPDRATYVTDVGERDSVTLGDGSRIVLGPGTFVSVAERDVELRGEAHFTVVHNAEKPFLVRAGGSIIRDLGTEFTVSGDSAAAVRVVVVEGMVAIARGSDSVTLQAGDVGVVSPDGRMAAQRGAASPDDLAWLQGRLIFRDAPLAEVASDLRRWYGVGLRVTDSSLANRHFTGEFAGEPVERVLHVLALALDATVERRGDTAFVTSRVPSK
jgi:transmembrane sensor